LIPAALARYYSDQQRHSIIDVDYIQCNLLLFLRALFAFTIYPARRQQKQ